MRDERSGCRGLCAGVSTFNTRKGRPGSEVTSLTADPNRTQNPVTRHPHFSNSATASWGSLGWRVFIKNDVLQLCLNCTANPGGRGFSHVSGSSARKLDALWSFTRRAPKVIPVKLEAATPGLASTGSPPWAVPAAVTSMCGEGGLEGRFSLWAGVGWWASGDLGVLSWSHLRVGWQWRSRIPEMLCSVPVWTQAWQVVRHLHLR